MIDRTDENYRPEASIAWAFILVICVSVSGWFIYDYYSDGQQVLALAGSVNE